MTLDREKSLGSKLKELFSLGAQVAEKATKETFNELQEAVEEVKEDISKDIHESLDDGIKMLRNSLDKKE